MIYDDKLVGSYKLKENTFLQHALKKNSRTGYKKTSNLVPLSEICAARLANFNEALNRYFH